MGNNMKFKAIAVRELKLSQGVRDTRAIAALSELDNSIHADLMKQPDLLHVEAVLVSEGINQNDDAFTREALRAALTSPILKPMNWQHQDEQILGAMYAVEARDMQGNKVSAIEEQPVELIVQGVVWHQLPHIKITAEQIARRIDSGDMFVSMECWFDSYDYGLYTQAGELYDLIPRNSETAFLDGYLRVNGGAGKYNGMRIGRALSGITFGGVAFVDKPANKRSFILNQFTFDPYAQAQEEEANIDDGLTDQVITNNVVSNVIPLNMEVNMNDLNRAAASDEQIQAAVERALAAQEEQARIARNEQELGEAKATVAELNEKVEAAEQQLAQLKQAVDTAFDKARAEASADEISAIDEALDGGAADLFAAKIEWIARSRAADENVDEAEDNSAEASLVEENAALKAELADLKTQARNAELNSIFAAFELDAEEVQAYVEAGQKIEDEDAFMAWLDESKTEAKAKMDKKADEKKEEVMEEKSEAKEQKDEEKPASLKKDEEKKEEKEAKAEELTEEVEQTEAAADESDVEDSAVANLDEMFEEVSEPNLGGASSAEAAANPVMGKLVAKLLRDPRNTQDN